MTPETFLGIVKARLGALNPEQAACVSNDVSAPTFIVAGPGSGKTRVLVQRALRHVCVDRMLPEQIVITTFTKKAAREIHSRLIEWGETLVAAAKEHAEAVGDPDLQDFLANVDVNRFMTGTLDSLCQDALEFSRSPAEPRYTVLDPFAARTLLNRKGDLYNVRSANKELDKFLGGFTFDGKPTQNLGGAVKALQPIAERIIQDCVSKKIFDDGSHQGRRAALQVIKRYADHLDTTAQLDFSHLEQVILQRLCRSQDVGTLGKVRAILVDEYQDTNLLQESIYFKLVRKTGAALTVVGDDDQSLYRFRGATIELFRDFATRVTQTIECPSINPFHLKQNYRSSKDIVDFFNALITNDPDFNPGARVQPLKPEITAAAGREPFPILGIFRESAEDCAKAVADFLKDVFEGKGRPIGETGQTLRGNPDGGNYGDAVLLGKTIREFGTAAFGKDPKPKFPHFLRQELEARDVRVFNPRGRPTHDVEAVRGLLGLILESLDPDGEIQEGMSLSGETKRLFDVWRAAAATLIVHNPLSVHSTSLQDTLGTMRKHASGQSERPVLDFVYAFVPYFPVFSNDPEHQVYLEGIARTAAQMASFSGYKGSVLRDHLHNRRSIEAAFRDFLAPLADGDIAVDEEIFANVPRNCFTMMTIHQAKGLEFPMVLVDVSTDFKGDYPMQRFKRFPEEPSSTVRLEEAFADFTSIGSLRRKRTPLQRTFEDIIREYYVAYSRPEAVLVLVGNAKTLQSDTNVKHIGQFWRSDGSWAWTDSHPASKPPPGATVPFVKL